MLLKVEIQAEPLQRQLLLAQKTFASLILKQSPNYTQKVSRE